MIVSHYNCNKVWFLICLMSHYNCNKVWFLTCLMSHYNFKVLFNGPRIVYIFLIVKLTSIVLLNKLFKNIMNKFLSLYCKFCCIVICHS